LIPEEMLAALARNYRLVLVSNTNALHFSMIRVAYAAQLRHFHSLVLSYEVHAMKPSPEIFRHAVDRAGCSPGECFYTDDIAAYVEAARGMGIDGVVFTSRSQIEEELRTRGISW
jgi:putative hydrolase of the HAD superfamily